MQHKKKVQKFSITNKVDSNFMNSFLYHSIGNLFYSKSLNLGITRLPKLCGEAYFQQLAAKYSILYKIDTSSAARLFICLIHPILIEC